MANRTIKLFLTKDVESFRKFQRNGILQMDKDDMLKVSKFAHAYEWIAEKMVKKVGEPPEKYIKYPVLAWYRCGQESGSNSECGEKPGKEIVQLEIEVPEENVLLIDSQMWAMILNYGYISENDEDEKAFEKRYQEAKSLLSTLGYNSNDARIAEVQKAIKQSWDRRLKNDKTGEQDMRAFIWEVTPDQVKKIR